MDLGKSGQGAVVARGDKESLRSLFHLLVGKPDSTQKIFDRPVQISPQSLIDLNERIQDKLKSHHLEGMVASASLIFEDKTTIDFGGWAEFQSFRWTTSKVTKEVLMRWRFLLSVQGYELPQQHALTVKLCADAKPIELLHAMLSKHPAEDDNSVTHFAPMVCRVDFISHTLAQELIAIVEEWNKGLQSPSARSNFFSKMDKYKDYVAQSIDYSIPVLFSMAMIGVLRMLFSSNNHAEPLTIGVAISMMSWLIATFIAVYSSQKVSNRLAKIAYASLDKYGMYSMFLLTNGDENRLQKIDKTNQKQVRNFLLSTFLAFALNVAAGIFTAIYWPTKGA